VSETERRVAYELATPVASTPPPPAPRLATERRAHPRVRFEAAVDFSSEDNFWSGFSMDVSEGGLFVATAAAAPRGTKVSLGFTIPGGVRIEAEGEVRWIREYNEKTPLVFPGVGVQFTRIDPTALAAIQRFAAARDPLFYVD
jgi:uncharacterized protein (TIGR02266 family)